MTTRKEANPAPEGRVKRVPVGARNKLVVKEMDPDFHYRIVNDTEQGQRLQMFQEAGYDFVEGVDTKTGRTDQPTDVGAKKTFAVGSGTTGYVMRIPKEFYEADQRAKQAAIDATEESMYEGPEEADYGSIKGKRGRAKAIDE